MANTAVYDFQALIGFNNKVVLSWEIDTDIVRAGDIFEIWRSNMSPVDEGERLATNLTLNFYNDETVNLYSKWRTYYYSLRVKRFSTVQNQYVEIFRTDCILYYDNNFTISKEIVRRRDIINRNYKDNNGFVFIRKTWGARCTYCYDENYNAPVLDNCPVCYGTSFEGGYYDKIPVSYSQGQSSDLGTSAGSDPTEPMSRNIQLPGPPIVHPGDVFVDKHRLLWRIENVSRVILHGCVLTQTLYSDRIEYDAGDMKLIERL